MSPILTIFLEILSKLTLIVHPQKRPEGLTLSKTRVSENTVAGMPPIVQVLGVDAFLVSATPNSGTDHQNIQKKTKCCF